MTKQFVIGILGVCLVSGQPSNAQPTGGASSSLTTNPPYLSGMPTVDQVMRGIQGKDPIDRLARQAGALWQLREVIYDIALSQRRNDRLHTSDEQRLANAYSTAYANLWQAVEKSLSQDRPRLSELGGYAVDRELLNDLLTRVASAAVRTEYAKANAEFAARDQQAVKAQKDAEKQAAKQTSKERETARCLAAGRPMVQCAAVLEGGVDDLLGATNPSLVKRPVAGFQMAGAYPGPDGSIKVFGPYVAVIGCKDIAGFFDYTVDWKNNHIFVNILSIFKDKNQKPVAVLELRPDGRLDGAGQTIAVGNTYEVGRSTSGTFGGGTVTTHYMATQTEVCTLGLLGPGIVPDFGFANAFLDKLQQGMTNAKPIKASPGLRMHGEYVGQGGFSVEFNNESVVVGCGEVVVSQPYTVERRGDRFLVNIQHDGKPVMLALASDGRLQGSGPIEVKGTVFTGRNTNGQLPFRPAAANCTIGTLTASTSSKAR